MRKVVNINSDWTFYKGIGFDGVRENAEAISLPHSWNATDGQDGGNDYFRGDCLYVRQITKTDLPQSQQYYLEILGANSSAYVYFNGEKIAEHDGGYSTWRVNITDLLKDENEVAIVVNNAPNDTVYPQVADFTFYGGIYRDVNIVCVNDTHFDLDYFGGNGVMITPVVDGENANVEVKCFAKNFV
ncbi:MAG: glycoside hydrolase family 2 protein, partial [Clostridia bacterium]|nr:glycoside hydrolase family 2 protein [Clostridia bacterium]